MIEDRPARHITDAGLSVLLTSDNTRWCVDCYVYLIVNMIDDKRIYVTSEATSSNKSLIQTIDNYLLVNEADIQCRSFSIGSSEVDTLFSVTNFQGVADLFLAKRTEPSNTQSSSVVMVTKETEQAKQVLIAKATDREYWSAQLGIYYICAQAYDALSSNIQVTEGRYNGQLTGEFNTLYNFFLATKAVQQFLLETNDLTSQRTLIKIDATVY